MLKTRPGLLASIPGLKCPRGVCGQVNIRVLVASGGGWGGDTTHVLPAHSQHRAYGRLPKDVRGSLGKLLPAGARAGAPSSQDRGEGVREEGGEDEAVCNCTFCSFQRMELLILSGCGLHFWLSLTVEED